ncbi:MAG: pentapeptide repeat-containing protein [Alphaproteobacteria bacterium]|nr:pentapeptide repeat-containing protein [Alphaproteobacteria bacterium]
MYLRSVEGKILFEGRFASIKEGVQIAVEKGCDLTGVDLRKTNLSGAFLDKAHMPKACFWGANLKDANMSEGHFCGADFRTANLLGTCLAESDLEDSDFSGAYFSRTIVTDGNLQNCRFSCPSIFTVDLTTVGDLMGAVYSHMGEIDCDLSHAPLIIQGLQKPLVFMDDSVLVGGEIKKIKFREAIAQNILTQISAQKLFL